MTTNFEKYKDDLKKLISTGEQLLNSMQYSCYPKEVTNHITDRFGDKASEIIEKFPNFDKEYQFWYTEALRLIKQLIPDRLSDFTRHYEIPKQRKELSYSTYTIEDYLQGTTAHRGGTRLFGKEAAIPRFSQQLAIVQSAESRFTSTLFDILQLTQADVFDSELDAASELTKKGFTRSAGALAGVVLERHLSQVCESHDIKVAKKAPSISELNDVLKNKDVIDTPAWRNIQYLGDIRNLCDHDKKTDPTKEQVDDLINGTLKVIKTIF